MTKGTASPSPQGRGLGPGKHWQPRKGGLPGVLEVGGSSGVAVPEGGTLKVCTGPDGGGELGNGQELRAGMQRDAPGDCSAEQSLGALGGGKGQLSGRGALRCGSHGIDLSIYIISLLMGNIHVRLAIKSFILSSTFTISIAHLHSKNGSQIKQHFSPVLHSLKR